MPKPWPHLPNAPIIEAIIDVRIEPEAEAHWIHQAEEFAPIAEAHPVTEKIIAGLLQTQWAGDTPFAQGLQREVIGFRFRNEREVIQVRVDGFTFSMLPPYSNWNELLEHAWKAWELYKTVRGEAPVIRLAVRYINRMQFPPDMPLGTYLKAPPHLPESLRFPLRRFFTNYDVELNSNTHATIIQTVEPETTGTLPVILDIAAFQVGSFTMNDERIRGIFEDLHDFKNEVFFESVTKPAIKLWQ